MPSSHASVIEAIPPARLRQLFRFPGDAPPNRGRVFDKEHLQEEYGLSETQAGHMADELLQLGYIRIDKTFGDYYAVTEKGKLFGLEKMNRPISIEKADALYAAFLDRVKIVNESPEYLLKVNGFLLWGDYLNGSNSIKTLEIQLILVYKNAETFDEDRDLQIQQHNSYTGIYRQYALPETKLRNFLKQRSPYLSVYLHKDPNTLSVSKGKFFDPDGNFIFDHIPDVATPSKESRNTNKSKRPKDKKPVDFIGRLVFNEPTDKKSKEQIIRKHTAKEVQLENIHGQIRDGMVAILRKQYPDCKTDSECQITGLGTRVDIARRTKDGKDIIYEIKTYPKAITSIRMAIGQLLEYTFYPERVLSEELYMVSHVRASEADLKYLQYIGKRIGVKIRYIHYNCITNQIEN